MTSHHHYLRSILTGEDASHSASPAPHEAAPSLSRTVIVSEEGKLTLVTLITIMFMLLLIGFVCNIGVAIKRKMELQNAADAASYTSALWMARGMNAITTTNHLLGEATAMMTIIDAFGGKLLETGDTSPVISESQAKCNEIRTLIQLEGTPASVSANDGNFSSSIHSIDERLVKEVSDAVLPDSRSDDGKHTAAATLYDAQLTLRSITILAFKMKQAAHVITVATFWIPFGIGPAIETACLSVHTYISATILPRVLIEWKMLEGLEVAVIPLTKVRTVMRETLVPALTLYADSVAGRSPGGKKLSANLLQSAPLNRAVDRSLNNLKEFYKGQNVELHVFPDVKKLRLPVEPETPPKNEVNKKIPPSLWSEEFEKDPLLVGMIKIFEAVTSPINVGLDVVGGLLDAVSGILSVVGLDDSFLGKINDELNSAIGKTKVDTNLPEYPGDYASNPSRDPNSKYAMPETDIEQTRVSQFTRASYPYVNSFRGPIYNFLDQIFKLSAAGHLYVHYSNRYLLANVHLIRTGDDDAEKAYVYVMENSSPQERGFETWTQDRSQGELLFSLSATATSKFQSPLLIQSMYKNPHKTGNVTISGSMFYNANGRQVTGGPQLTQTQVNSGWNTLNWTPPVKALEWGDHPVAKRDVDFTSLFTGSQQTDSQAQVTINWQAKLIPLTPEGRLLNHLNQGLQDSSSTLPGNSKSILKKALKHRELLNH
ncbi:Tad domain-containing protein [Planctomicrobium sp. SH668]|uniref:Tad domain-containing protein n=1 Tax=Planctomicrobium sp. SH668 TaxID=3448126 RepID=UPI003F5AEE9E